MAGAEINIPTSGPHRHWNCILESTPSVDFLSFEILSEVVRYGYSALLSMIPCAVRQEEGARRFGCHSFVQVCLPPSGSQGERDKKLAGAPREHTAAPDKEQVPEDCMEMATLPPGLRSLRRGQALSVSAHSLPLGSPAPHS